MSNVYESLLLKSKVITNIEVSNFVYSPVKAVNSAISFSSRNYILGETIISGR